MNNNPHVTIPVFASFHQGDISRFKSSSVGRQCVANCIASIIQFQDICMDECSQDIMDKILYEGDKLYTEIYNGMTNKQDYFLIDDIPRTLSCFGQQWDFQVIDEIDVGLSGSIKEDKDKMLTHLLALFKDETYAIMMLGNLAYASASAHQGCFIYLIPIAVQPHLECR